MGERDAYITLRNFFLKHNEYTHMAISPDDLIVTRHDFEILLDDIRRYDFPVISGICNVSYQLQDMFTPCIELPDENIGYVWLSLEEINNINGIIPVKFDAFACSIIRRDIVKKIIIEGDHLGGRMDLQFARDCDRLDIPLYVDTRAKMFHLRNRLGNGNLENCGQTDKPPTIIFEQV